MRLLKSDQANQSPIDDLNLQIAICDFLISDVHFKLSNFLSALTLIAIGQLYCRWVPIVNRTGEFDILERRKETLKRTHRRKHTKRKRTETRTSTC